METWGVKFLSVDRTKGNSCGTELNATLHELNIQNFVTLQCEINSLIQLIQSLVLELNNYQYREKLISIARFWHFLPRQV